ncbi:hypothetical protein [Brumicola pallidula]|uniref:hypothetical protein n=1 Tax=Brumicola pallidula TaxID=56807 RepID=UPI0011D2B85B|nr:hypothetical protein [Glaciecola pallidula]
MIKLFPLLLFVFISNASASTINAENKPTIYFDYLPFVKTYETQQAKNAVSATTLLFMQNITRHAALKFLPTIRLLAELDIDTEQSKCALFKLKTAERLDNYYFSLPISFLSTNRLYLRPGMQALSVDLLNEDGEIKNITSLFNDNQNTILLWQDISYGELVDAALRKIPSKNKIIIKGLTSHGSSAKMIERGRTNYAILFPSEVAEFESEMQPFDLLSYRIDGTEPISTGHLMCNKTDASKAWLDKFNAVLVELYESPEFIKANTFKISSQEKILVLNAINQLKFDILTSD